MSHEPVAACLASSRRRRRGLTDGTNPTAAPAPGVVALNLERAVYVKLTYGFQSRGQIMKTAYHSSSSELESHQTGVKHRLPDPKEMRAIMTYNAGVTAGARLRGEMRPFCSLPWAACWTFIFGLLLVFCLPCVVTGEAFAKANPGQVEAAFLRNFAHYVTWPAQAFNEDRSHWNVCILGRDPFGEVLEKTLEGRKEQGRSFETFRADSLDQLPTCQIVFVAYKDAAKRRAALTELKHQPVLTVGEAPGFLEEGGIIRFQIADYVEMSVNLDQARSVSLQIQTKMLEVTHEVLENGVVRKQR
jgi:hypothetical protein